MSGIGRRRREHVIAVLEDEETPMTIDELTDYIVAWETDRYPAQSPPDRRQVREELHDVDLPALADNGLVAFDQAEGLVGRHEATADPETGTGDTPHRGAPATERWPGLLDRYQWGRRTGVGVTVAAVLGVTLLAAMVAQPTTVAVIVGGGIAVVAVLALLSRGLSRHRD